MGCVQSLIVVCFAAGVLNQGMQALLKVRFIPEEIKERFNVSNVLEFCSEILTL
jgi:hypothetical protein